MRTEFWRQDILAKFHLKDRERDGRMQLRWILVKQVLRLEGG